MKIILKDNHKTIIKKILYRGRKYCFKYYKIPSVTKIYQIFLYSLIVTFLLYPILTNFSDKYDHKNIIGKIIYDDSLYIENPLLNSFLIKIKTSLTLTSPEIYSICENNQKLVKIEKQDNYNIYEIKFSLNNPCKDNNIYIKNGETIYIKTKSQINIYNYSRLFDEYTNHNNFGLEKIINNIDNNKYHIGLSLYNLIKLNTENNYKKNIIKQILKARLTLKYLIPVAGKEIPTRPNIIPNAPRPYRANYTDGVHHGWDLFAARGTPVRSISDGIIYRIKNDFCWESFDKILWKNLTTDDKLINLDIYRGNQVWIKTADGNITIYSHLESIPQNLQEGQVVKEGDYLGQVGRSGVPDKEYTDFHLHFEIQVNPHNNHSPSLLDVMRWDFWGKGKKYEDIIEGQKKIFK